jgi:hypothetical protein
MQYIFIEFTKRHVIVTKLQITIVSKSGAIPIFISPIGMKDVEWVVSSSMIFVQLQNKSVLSLFKTVATSSYPHMYRYSKEGNPCHIHPIRRHGNKYEEDDT